MYNQEVNEFFQIGQTWDYTIRSSRVHYASQVSYVERAQDLRDDDTKSLDREEELDSGNEDEDEDEDDTVGSYWTGHENRLVFKLLSRYSIQRVSEWSHVLHEKSIFEIMEYYKILRSNLRQLRRQKFKGLVKIADMDIAYDMDEQFIEMEEYMSTKPTKKTITMKDTIKPVSSELIDIDNWKKRWNSIYSKSHLEEVQEVRREVVSIDIASVRYMEDLVRQQLRRLLWYTVLPELQHKRISKRSLRALLIKDDPKEHKRQRTQEPNSKTEKEEEEEEVVEIHHSHKKKKKKNIAINEDHTPFYPTVITSAEVDKAITVMKNERNTKHTQTLGESVMDTINKYEIHYRPIDGNIFRKRSVRESIIPEMVHQTTSLTTAINSNTTEPGLTEFRTPTGPNLDNIELEYTKMYAIPSENREARDDELDAVTDARDTELSSQVCQAIYSFVLKKSILQLQQRGNKA